jgi:kynureninase
LRVGTPPVLSLAALDAALDVFDDVDMPVVRAKSLALTDLFVEAVQAQLGSFGVQVVVPREHHRRGSQVCLRHPDAYPVVQALIERRVVGDFREPDLARFGFAPLTLRHADVLDAVDTLEQVLSSGQWQQPRFAHRTEVTCSLVSFSWHARASRSLRFPSRTSRRRSSSASVRIEFGATS